MNPWLATATVLGAWLVCGTIGALLGIPLGATILNLFGAR